MSQYESRKTQPERETDATGAQALRDRERNRRKQTQKQAAAYSSRPYRRAFGYFIVPKIALITEYRNTNGARIHTSGCMRSPPLALMIRRARRVNQYSERERCKN